MLEPRLFAGRGEGILGSMDDRNLVAMAEQAAATSRTQGGPVAGCTVLSDDGRVFKGCALEYSDSELYQDPIANAIGEGRVNGMRKVARVGYYCPTGGTLPSIPLVTLRRLKEIGTEGLGILFSPGTGERIEVSLSQLLAESESA